MFIKLTADLLWLRYLFRRIWKREHYKVLCDWVIFRGVVGLYNKSAEYTKFHFHEVEMSMGVFSVLVTFMLINH